MLQNDQMPYVQSGDLEDVAAPIDFIGLNYYNRNLARANTPDNLPPSIFQAEKTPENWTEMGWENYPDGLYQTLMRLYVDYQVPKIYVTENGASYSTPPNENNQVPDQLRLNYLNTHFAAAHQAIESGAPLAGYFVWSLLDNFEWGFGYSQRFGIVRVDFETQKRIPKGSALWYSKVITENAI
jgi:beta-glucosidase